MPFQYYPKINYKLNDKTYPVTDILRRVRGKPSGMTPLHYEQDMIDSNLRPDNVASMLYGNSYYDWLVMQASKITNPSSDWPINSQVFSDYVEKKYPDEVVILGDNFFSQPKIVSDMEQFQTETENILKVRLFSENLKKFYIHSTPHKNSTIDAFWDLDIDGGNVYSKRLNSFLLFLDYMDDDWNDYIEQFKEDLEVAYVGITDSNIIFFKREIDRFKQFLVRTVSNYSSYIGNNTFFIENELIKGSSTGVTAVVKSFNPNTLELIIKNRDGDFDEGEVIRGLDSKSAFDFNGDNLKKEYLASFNNKSSDAIAELSYYSFVFEPVTSLLLEVDEKCVFDSNESFEIESIFPPDSDGVSRLKYKQGLTSLPTVGTVFTGVTSNMSAQVISISISDYIDYKNVEIDNSDSVIISDIITSDAEAVELFDASITSYGAIRDTNGSFHILDINDVDSLVDLETPVLSKIGKTYGLLSSVVLYETVSSQSEIFVIENKSYLQYEIDKNEENQLITYLKPEVVDNYVQEFINLIGT